MRLSIIRVYPNYDTGLDEQIRAKILAKTPEKYKAGIINLLSVSLKEMKSMKKRDEKIVEALLSKDGSTVMTIGHVHLDSVASILSEKCKLGSEERKQDNPKTTKAVR